MSNTNKLSALTVRSLLLKAGLQVCNSTDIWGTGYRLARMGTMGDIVAVTWACTAGHPSYYQTEEVNLAPCQRALEAAGLVITPDSTGWVLLVRRP